MKQKKIILAIIIVLAIIGLAWLLTGSPAENKGTGNPADKTSQTQPGQPNVPPPDYHADSGHIIAQVVSLEKKEKGEFIQIKINEVIAYSRDQEAKYDQLKAGDTLEVYLAWGSAPRSVKLDLGTKTETIDLAGLKAGDTIDANINGCPEFCNSGFGWAIYAYKPAQTK